MNTEHIIEVAETIRQNAERFNMDSFHDEGECGSIHCIGGWAAVKAVDSGCKQYGLMETQGRKYLGLSIDESADLFYPRSSSSFWKEFCNRNQITGLFDLFDEISCRPNETADYLIELAHGNTPPLRNTWC